MQPQGANISFNRKQIFNESACVVLLGSLESAYLSSSLKDQIYIFSLKCQHGYQIFDIKLKLKKDKLILIKDIHIVVVVLFFARCYDMSVTVCI